MTQVYEAQVHGASGGFGMGEVGEWFEQEGCEDISDWESMVGDAGNNAEVVPADESPFGDIYNGAGTLYRHSERVGEDGQPEWSYCMVDVREA